jgi:tetratricopeptide (TPR) repeat protein
VQSAGELSADALHFARQFELALTEYTAALNEAKEDAARAYAYAQIADCHDRLKRSEPARAAIDRAIALAPQVAAYWNRRGLLRPAGESYADYCRATELDPTDPVFWSNRARHGAALERFDDADRSFARSVELDPSSAAVHRDWGELCLQRKDYTAAIARLEKAIALEPDDPQFTAECRALTKIAAAAAELEKSKQTRNRLRSRPIRSPIRSFRFP